MPNYRADQFINLLRSFEAKSRQEDDQVLLDENTLCNRFFPISEELALTDTVDVSYFTPSSFCWGGAVSLLSPTFARAGTAYVPTSGAVVASNEPRYVTGKFGMGVVVEEGTTNLLTANQSSVETNTTGFASIGATVTRDTTTFYQGSASLKVTTANAASREGFELTAASTAGQPYTFSCVLRGSGTIRVELNTSGTDRVGANFVLTNSWQPYSVTLPSAGATGTIYIDVITPTQQAVTFYYDTGMLATKSYATSWTLGGTTRNSETLTLPTTGLQAAQGTIEAWVYVNSVARRQVAGQFNRVFEIPRGNGNSGILLYHFASNTNWVFETRDDANVSTAVTVADTTTPDGWRHFAVKWSATEAKFFIDGILRGTIATPKLPTSFGATMNVGSGNGNNYANTYFDSLRISSTYRTDAEIAANAAGTAPMAVDASTLALVNFDGTLQGESRMVDANFDWNGGGKWNAS